MAWTLLPCDKNTRIQEGLWNESRDAIDERNPLVGSPVTLPTEFTGTTRWGKIAEYQQAIRDLVDCNAWADTEANDFRTLITGATAAGKKNIFELALPDGTETDFTYDHTHRLHIKHWNEMRLVLNLCFRVKVEVPNGLCTGDAATYLSEIGDLESTFAAARAHALTGLNGGGSWTPTYSHTLGRIAEATFIPGPPDEWQVNASHIGGLYGEVDTSFLNGYTLADAWLLVERFSMPSAGGLHVVPFEFKLQVGTPGSMTDVRTGLTPGDAADISGWQRPGLAGAVDVWKADVDVADINQGGDTRIEAVYADTPTDDDGTWTDGTKIYVNAYDNFIGAWLIVAVSLDFHS